LKIPADHPSFVDHFPGNPVVPGSLLVQWILEYCADRVYEAIKIRQCNFVKLLRPGDEIEIRLDETKSGYLKVWIFCRRETALQAILDLKT